MSLRPLLFVLAASFAFPLAGCDQIEELTGGKEKAKKADDDDDDKKKKKKKKSADEEEEEETASAAPSATAAPTETAAAEPSAEPEATATADAPADPAPATPPGRTAVPTTDEWNATSEVTVLGSSALGCETKSVREWIRVSCRGEDPTRGKPTGVTITKGGGKGDTFTFAAGGVASLVYPFFEGQNLGASFTWEKHQRAFRAEWANGAPKPTAYGIFDGGDAHLKPSLPTPTAVAKPPPPPPPPTSRPTAEPPPLKRPVLKIPPK